MATLTGKLVAETYRALLKTIDNDILIASEKQITDGMGGGSGIFLDSQGFIRANKYKVTNGLATQFLKADGSIDGNTYLTGITSAQVIMALGYTPVTSNRLLTINGLTYDLSQNRTWNIESGGGTWGSITGTLSNQLDLQAALNAKFNNPTGTIEEYIRGDGSIAPFNNAATKTKNEVKLGATLSKGTPVYVSSANGTNMIVSASSNTTEATSSKTFGLLETGGVLNDLVQCVTFGLIEGLDTSAATAGDPVWLGPNGTLLFGLANKPYAPAHMVYIGVVTRVQSSNGEIFVNVQNGFELDELHNVAARTPSNNEGLFYETSTSLWKNKSIATVLGYVPQPQLNGTGFVKADGTTISYDNSDYQPLDADLTAIASIGDSSGLLRKIDATPSWVLDTNEYLTMAAGDVRYESLSSKKNSLVANSTTFYYSVTAVNNALADKMNVNGGTFTGNLTIASSAPSLIFNDISSGGVFRWRADGGQFFLQNGTTILTTLMSINSSGAIVNASSITATSFIKSGGTSGQFLKADGSVDSNSYQPLDADLTAIAGLALTTGLLRKNGMNTWELDQNQYITTADLSGYQTVANLSSNLTASATKYPSVNAVNTGLGLRLALAGGTMTGELILGYSTPTLTFNDTSSGNVYKFISDAGTFRLNYLSTNIVSVSTTGAITAGSFIKSGGTSSQYLMADGSVSTSTGGVTGSGTANYIPKWTSSNVLGNSAISDDGTTISLISRALSGTSGLFSSTLTSAGLKINGSGNLNLVPTVYGNNGYISFRNIADSAARWIIYNYTIGGSTYGSLNFSVGGNDKFFISEIGNIGIGTTTIQQTATNRVVTTLNGTSSGIFNIATSDVLRAYFYGDSGVAELYSASQLNLLASGSNSILFYTNGSERFRVSNSGNLLVNTTTDSGYKLDVNGTGRFIGGIIAASFSTPSTGAAGSTTWNFYHDQYAAGDFGIWAGSTNRILINAAGNIGIGTTSPEYKIDLCQFMSTTSTEIIRLGVNNGPGGGGGTSLGSGIMWKANYTGYTRRSAGIMQIAEDNYFRAGIGFFTNNNADTTSDWSERFRIYSAGNATFFSYVTATAFYESSDIRLKTLIDESPQIAGIENLEAKLYEKNGKIEFGYFAQEAEKLMPYAVTKGSDGFLSLSYREVHTAKIARLEKEVAELKEKLNAA